MVAGQHSFWITHWNRNGGPFDILAIAVALIVIAGGVFILHSASQEYRVSALPTPTVTNGVPALTADVPAQDARPRQ